MYVNSKTLPIIMKRLDAYEYLLPEMKLIIKRYLRINPVEKLIKAFNYVQGDETDDDETEYCYDCKEAYTTMDYYTADTCPAKLLRVYIL